VYRRKISYPSRGPNPSSWTILATAQLVYRLTYDSPRIGSHRIKAHSIPFDHTLIQATAIPQIKSVI